MLHYTAFACTFVVLRQRKKVDQYFLLIMQATRKLAGQRKTAIPGPCEDVLREIVLADWRERRWRSGAAGSLSQRITTTEREHIKKLRSLWQRWGYRAGTGQQHTNFELRTHGSNAEADLFPLQRYTDYLFRSLQQLSPETEGGRGLQNIIASDLKTLERSVPLRGPVQDSKSEAARATTLLREYFADKKVCELWRLLLLGDEKRTDGHSTPTALYSGLIVAAEALLLLAHGMHAEARQMIDEYFEVNPEEEPEGGTETEEQDEASDED